MTSDETKQTPEEPAAKIVRKPYVEWFVVAFLCLVLVVCILPCGLPWPIEGMFTLLFGWCLFLYRSVLEMRPSGEQFALWLIGVALLAGLCQWLGAGLLSSFRKEASSAETTPVWRFRWTVMIVLAMHAMFLGGLAVTGIVRQSYWLATTDEPLLDSASLVGRRWGSSNNLKQLGFATYDYHETFDRFPQSAFTTTGRPLHSWVTMLLPFIEHKRLYDSIDLEKPWNDPSQRQAFAQRIMELENPGLMVRIAEGEPALANYAANRRVIGPLLQTKLSDVRDGTTKTILFGEVRSEIPAWGDPTNWRDPASGINQSPHGFGSPFKGGAQFVFVDGSVQFLSDDIDPEVLKALSTPDGGEESHDF